MHNFTHQEIARIRYAEVLREARRHVVVADTAPPAPTARASRHARLLERLAFVRRLAPQAAIRAL